ncbi:MAG: FIVAR domain-containing protein, partial [Bifidobacteriaceae bacterium]|nr:FIVAR domain-containing protein [Bifidobacteriaceae bacterium]
LHQRGHGQQTAPDAVQNAFFTHYLYGGAPSGGEQKVWAYSSKYLEATGTVNWNNVQPEVLPDWPPAGTEDVTLKLGPATGREEAGTMTFAAGGDALTAETFTDQTHPQVTGLDYGNGTSADVPYAEYPAVAGTGAAAGRTVEGHRLVYLSDEIGQDFRIAGAPKVKLNFALTNRTKANLSVILVSYPKAGTAINGSAVNTAPQIVTRGWADPQNRTSLTYDEPVEQGTFYDISFATDPKDYTFTAGSRLALVVMSTDPGFTIRPADGAQLAIKPALSSVTFPVVGGLGALAAANPGGTIPTSVLGIALGVYSLYESQESRYTPESYAPFAAALAEARAIAEWGFAPRETIDTAAAAVESAARNLVEAVDTSVLDSFIASARAILADPSNHVAANLPALRAALDAAVVARAGGGLTQAQATAAAIALATALANVHPKGDRTGLTGLITVADGLESARYTPATWDAMAVALAAARPVAANPEASVDDVETAFTALRASLDALVLRAAKAGLASAIAVAEAMAANLPAYHPASVAGLEAAAAQARAVQADLDASTQAVTAAQAALVQVIAGARLKSAETLAAAAGAGPAELATAKPKIAGRAEVGRRLRAKAGAWSPKPALSYQWYRNGAAIPKAVKASYKVKRADAGKRLTVKVTGAKPGYAAATRAAAAKKVRRL